MTNGKTSATVTAVNADSTVDVFALGATIPRVPYPSWYAPAFNDSVVLDWIGTRPFVETVFSGSLAYAPGSYAPGSMYSSPHTGKSTAAPAIATGGAIPFQVGRRHLWTAMSAEVTSAAGSGGLLRFGLYSDTGIGYPQALIGSPGAVSTTGTGMQTVNFAGPITLIPGLYWLAFQVEVNQSTLRSVVGTTAGLFGMVSIAGAAVMDGFYGTSGWSPGAMPATFPSGCAAQANLPLIALTAL